jgi:uncharacterized protein
MIRRATPRDLPAILKLNNFFVPKVSEIDLPWLEKYLVEAEVFDVFLMGNEIVAFIVGMLPNCDYNSVNFLWFKERFTDFLYVDRIAVNDAAQGQGIGKNLYDHIEKVNRAAMITCEVNIAPPNPQSYEFHRKVGFIEVGQQDTKGGTIRVAMLQKPHKRLLT